MLNIVVCAKAVPDPKEACNIKIDPVTKTLLRCEVPMVLNPLDKNAVEAALQLKKEVDAQVSIISMGPPEAGNIVKECLALGADQGFLLSDTTKFWRQSCFQGKPGTTSCFLPTTSSVVKLRPGCSGNSTAPS